MNILTAAVPWQVSEHVWINVIYRQLIQDSERMICMYWHRYKLGKVSEQNHR